MPSTDTFGFKITLWFLLGLLAVPMETVQGLPTDALPSADILAAIPFPNTPNSGTGPVQLDLRRHGLKIDSQWYDGETWSVALQQGLEAIRARENVEDIDAIVVNLSYGYTHIPPGHLNRMLGNKHRGIRGLQMTTPKGEQRLSPTDMVARNLSFKKAKSRLKDALASPLLSRNKMKLVTFDSHQFLISLEPELRVRTMFRGNDVVPFTDVNQANVKRLANDLGDWLCRQVSTSGRMTYKYFPSRGEYTKSNNMIRQWMATTCLQRWARFSAADVLPIFERNLLYNLKHYYQQRKKGIGVIKYDGKVKLGACALAALAIRESPLRSTYAARERGLALTIDALWQPDGAFRTFYEPSRRNDNQNFYPGEALLYWATRYRATKDETLRERFMTSVRYYQEWHLAHRNPAFVPWHTQAYYLMWQETQDETLIEPIFVMNDWLLGVQEWEQSPFPDMQGRFYDAQRPQFGPPHASSTGVYMEGLIDAFALARERGDKKRAKAYRQSIRRGLRSVMQLQYQDDTDTFYISKKERVLGSLRTRVYDNTIRVDNVQHNLMAIMKIMACFETADYLE